MAQIEFLKFPVSIIRRSVRDIDSSYRNPWDLYAELAQNAVDAITKVNFSDGESGLINIEINALDKSIVFEDNGCGISKDNLLSFLSLFSSGKDGDHDTVGEKGVGLKFVYFSSKYFEIISSDGNSGARAVIKDAVLWKNATSDDILKCDFEEMTDVPRGTKIILKDIDLFSDDIDSASIFNLSFEQLKFVLRTKTYLGNTDSIWDTSKPEIKICLKYTDTNGIKTEEVLKHSYALPTEAFKKTELLDIEEFERWLKEKDHTDREKRNRLQNKVLTIRGEYTHNRYRKISYYACFFPSRHSWDNINMRYNLLPKDAEDDYESKYHYCMFESGIYMAVKGMPTGISIENPITGNAGYWPNCFIVFQDDTLKFDIGRKSIHGKSQAIYQAKAQEIFYTFTKYVTKYSISAPEKEINSITFDRYEIRKQVESMVDLKSDIVSFVKNPSEQEASVAAIFFQLVALKAIDDIKPIITGYRQKYDLYAYFFSTNGKQYFKFIEFKSHLRNLTKDFSEARKVFDEMDYVICWDVNDEDIRALKRFGIDCEILNDTIRPLDCPKSASHIMTISNVNPVYVIDIKRLT